MFNRIADQYRHSTVIVIGAGGIGEAIIQLLARQAAHLVVGDRSSVTLDAITLPSTKSVLSTRIIDVQDANSVAEFFAFAKSAAGAPHYLFYTAGILNLEPLTATTPTLWNTAVAINLNGAFYCAQAAAEQMIPQQRGSILLLGSIAGTKARSGSRVNPVYNTTKAGLSAFVNAAAMQWRPHGIRINSIAPGPTTTAMMGQQPPEVQIAVNEIALDRRQNLPTEVAEFALFVAAHGRFTGEDLAMGGGAGLGG